MSYICDGHMVLIFQLNRLGNLVLRQSEFLMFRYMPSSDALFLKHTGTVIHLTSFTNLAYVYKCKKLMNKQKICIVI